MRNLIAVVAALVGGCVSSSEKPQTRGEARMDEPTFVPFDAMPPQPATAAADRQWWCSHSTLYAVDHCEQIRENCDGTRNAMIRAGHQIDPCAPVAQVYCYRVRVQSADPNIDGTVGDMCSSRLDWCQRESTTAPNVTLACRGM